MRRTGMPRIALTAVCGLTLLSACAPATAPAGAPGPLDGATSSATPPTTSLGAGPAVPYVAGRWYVAPDRRLRLPGGRRGISGSVPYDDGLLVADATWFEGSNGLSLVRHGRRLTVVRCSSGTPVASADGRYVAWSTVRCPESDDTSPSAIHRARADGTGEVVLPVGAGLVSPVGFLGHDVVYNLGFDGGAWVSDLSGPPRRIGAVSRVVDVDRHRRVLIGSRGDRASLVVRVDGTVLWRLDRGDLIAFSLDGGRVLALRDERLVVLRARDGSPLTTIDVPADVEAWSVAWETGRTLLALQYDAGWVAIVRLHLDGRVERATAWRRVDATGGPYVLLP